MLVRSTQTLLHGSMEDTLYHAGALCLPWYDSGSIILSWIGRSHDQHICTVRH